MHELKPFAPTTDPVTVRGTISFDGPRITVRFDFRDPEHRVQDAPAPADLKQGEIIRVDGLWQTTCFEAFWGETGKTEYYELNLSPDSNKWNLYRFDDYRSPQPPRASHDFELIAFKRTTNTLEATLKGSPMNKPEARLCAVIRTENGPQYFSTRHSQPKADFHDRASFTLKPGHPV